MQGFFNSWPIWCGRTVLILALCLAVGCSSVPRKYLREADTDVTLTAIVATPDRYRDRLVILGGVILEEEMRDGWLWLHAKNRPLDQDYRPSCLPAWTIRKPGGIGSRSGTIRVFLPRTAIGPI